eukprot:1157226-Pelagomonas_calceolata.AAC.1
MADSVRVSCVCSVHHCLTLALLLLLGVCCLSAGMAAQHRREREWDKGIPADQVALHQKQHP